MRSTYSWTSHEANERHLVEAGLTDNERAQRYLDTITEAWTKTRNEKPFRLWPRHMDWHPDALAAERTGLIVNVGTGYLLAEHVADYYAAAKADVRAKEAARQRLHDVVARLTPIAQREENIEGQLDFTHHYSASQLERIADALGV